jgi:hypothetical protein
VNDERDPLDDTLADGLRALAPSEFTLDADRTLGGLRPRLKQARNRRRLAVSTSVLGALVVVVAGAAVLRPDSSSRINVSGRSHPTVSTLEPSTTIARHPATTTSVPRRAPTTLPGPAVTAPTTPSTTPATTPNTGAPPPAPLTKTYTATGGRITIRFANGRLTLVSRTAAPGFTAEVHKQDPQDVEVRFDNGSHESRIRVRVENGQLRPEISEN